MHPVLVSVGWVGLLVTVTAIGPTPACNGTPNELPIYDQVPTLVATVPNGVRYVTGVRGKSQMHIVQTRGTPYQQGVAMGQLFREEVPIMLNLTLEMIDSYLDHSCGRILHPLCHLIESGKTIPNALEAFNILVHSHTPRYILDEIAGMAAATGISESLLEGMANIPEIIRGSCSMVGASLSAVPPGVGLQQFRALMLKPFLTMQAYPLIAIAFNPGTDLVEARVGYLGLPGVFTGFNSAGIGLSEKSHGEYPRKGALVGEPWAYVLRDVLRTAATAEQAVAIMRDAKRTCPIYVGVGQLNSQAEQFVEVEYAARTPLNVSDWRNCSIYENHPRVQGVAWIDEEAQPSAGPEGRCYLQVLQALHGNLTAINMLKYLAPLAQTGGLHAVSMDFRTQTLYVANAQFPLTGDGSRSDFNDSAFNRQIVKVEMRPLFEWPNNHY